MAIKADEFRARAEWATTRERGSVILLRAMTFISLHLGRPVGRVLLYFIAAYFFAFAPTARRHARAYLRRALGREPTAADRFRQVLSFASTVHDRVYLLNDRFDLFDVSCEGEHWVEQALHAGHGAFLIGSHLGSFEIIRSVGLRQPGLQVVMAMYEGNARKVNEQLAAINPSAQGHIIPLGHMDAMLRIQEALDRGHFMGILGDRTLGHEASLTVPFLGEPAAFPVGPMRAAALMRRPVIFMAGLYRGGNRYHVIFEPLADFSGVSRKERDTAISEAVVRYATLLERYCRTDPYSWFNFHDFWQSADEPR